MLGGVGRQGGETVRWDGAPEGSMSLPPGDDDFWGPVPMAETESFLTISEMTGRDFPAGPVVSTHRFHYQGPGFSP